LKFVEETGANWAAIQIKAVEMEIEQQKREWEEKRLVQQQQEEQEKQRAEKEDNELLTYSREDALNKVNNRSKRKSQVLSKRKSDVDINHSGSATKRSVVLSKNGSDVALQNGVTKDSVGGGGGGVLKSRGKVMKISPKASPSKRSTRANCSMPDEASASTAKLMQPRRIQRTLSRKSDRSTSIASTKSHEKVRSTSESTRSTADSVSRRTTTHDDSDSECSFGCDD